jgi:ceramide synthetase
MSNTNHTEKQPNGEHTAEKKKQNGSREHSTKRKHDGMSLHDKLFVALLFLAVPWGFYFMYQLDIWMANRSREHPGKVFPKVSDFLETGVYIAIFVVLRLTIADKLFSKIGDWVLPKNKWDPETRFHKVDRFSIVIFKFCFFSFVSIYGYYILRDKEWVPPIIGGHGDVANCFKDEVLELDPEIKAYYLLQLAYHAHSFLFQFRMTHRADFYEMVLHHVATIFLIAFSYLTNFTRVGSLVLLTHDFSDLFGYAIKSVVDTSSAVLTLTIYAGLLMSWGFMRLYVFPVYIINTTIRQFQVPGYHLFNGLLITLLVLHVYWYFLFLKMGFTFLTSGKREDIIDKVKKKKLQQNE